MSSITNDCSLIKFFSFESKKINHQTYFALFPSILYFWLNSVKYLKLCFSEGHVYRFCVIEISSFMRREKWKIVMYELQVEVIMGSKSEYKKIKIKNFFILFFACKDYIKMEWVILEKNQVCSFPIFKKFFSLRDSPDNISEMDVSFNFNFYLGSPTRPNPKFLLLLLIIYSIYLDQLRQIHANDLHKKWPILLLNIQCNMISWGHDTILVQDETIIVQDDTIMESIDLRWEAFFGLKFLSNQHIYPLAHSNYPSKYYPPTVRVCLQAASHPYFQSQAYLVYQVFGFEEVYILPYTTSVGFGVSGMWNVNPFCSNLFIEGGREAEKVCLGISIRAFLAGYPSVSSVWRCLILVNIAGEEDACNYNGPNQVCIRKTKSIHHWWRDGEKEILYFISQRLFQGAVYVSS
ncbi:hypothetical protein VP01_26g4 [Puccinia sorghi]|uniref:Uncharacterized protein n=1 Tax=Puccinia sorghi TaxID=27349 RepID=A0A0L6V4C2_9BASI|nr:hypothetical protein VP01_26g4 [Puccinia sorghi]